MNEPDGTVLRGLPGTNPLGFLAALGAQVALAEAGIARRLHWSDSPIPRAVLSPSIDLREIAAAVRHVSDRWLAGPALGEDIDDKLKLKPPEIRDYLARARAAGDSAALASCLLAEGSLDNSGKAKPTDLYFTAGQQKFVVMARNILGEVTEEEITGDLVGPWRYESKRASLMWDTADDRQHAYSAVNPSGLKKLTNPGAEALALIGLSAYPCFGSPQGTATQGCSGTWKNGAFAWPIWAAPATTHSVRSLLAHVQSPDDVDHRQVASYPAWGLLRVMRSQIRRSSPGGSGTFGPPRVVWGA